MIISKNVQKVSIAIFTINCEIGHAIAFSKVQSIRGSKTIGSGNM